MAIVLALALAAPRAFAADDHRLKAAEQVLTEMAGSFDSGIPKSLLTKAQCVVIIPGVKKGALGVGGQYGRGYCSCRLTGGRIEVERARRRPDRRRQRRVSKSAAPTPT